MEHTRRLMMVENVYSLFIWEYATLFQSLRFQPRGEGVRMIRLPHFIDDIQYSPVFTTEELLAQNELGFTTRRLNKGEFLFFPDERHPYTYHILSGLVRLYLTSREGTEKTLFYHAPNTQFGFQGFKRDGLTRTTAVAITDCELLQFAYSDLLGFCDEHTEYYLAYIEYLFQITTSLTGEIETLSFDSGARRLASLLLASAISSGTTISYSIDELASIVGTHRNTITNALSHLRSEGYIDQQQRPIVVSDPEGLSRYLGM